MGLRGDFWRFFYRAISHDRIMIGKNFCRRKNVDIHVSENGRIRIGDNVFFNKYCTVASKLEIIIGNSTIFGESVRVYDSNHVFSDPGQEIYKQGFNAEKITIGEDCWIGSNTVILKGVSIGNHSIIGAGCVIDFDVPEWTIVKRSASSIDQIERRH